MKVAYCSDLHLEFYTDIEPVLNELYTDADVLVLAGDICEARRIQQYRPFFKEMCMTYKHVIYVAGNHEFYRGEYNKCIEVLSNMGFPNLHFLHNRVVEIDGKRFGGATLWTDIPAHAQWFLKRGMNDYHLITMNVNGSYRKLRPEDTVLEHHRTLAWLNTIEPLDVMVSHHAPSTMSIADRYIGNEYNKAYATNLGEYLYKAKVWIHGHMHEPFDYVTYCCNVKCNPRGYEDERKDFSIKVFDI